MESWEEGQEGMWPAEVGEAAYEEDHEEEEGSPFFGAYEVPVEVALQVFVLLPLSALAQAEAVCRRWQATVGPTSPHLVFLWRAV
jgi:hypothetical protein